MEPTTDTTATRPRRRGARLALVVVVAAALLVASAGCASVGVSGNHLVNGGNVRLLGVNRSGAEFACTKPAGQGGGFFDGPVDAASIQAMVSWHVNTVRVPLNEDCWLGINGMTPGYTGAPYRDAIAAFVSDLNGAGLTVILDLHWNAPGTQKATGQQKMVDADHGPAFWSSVATQFRDNTGVMFDLYNEPHDISWPCWRDGCTVDGWQSAGMQALVNVVRATGAKQPILLGGLAWSNDLSQWLQYKPTDPANGLVASFHLYNFNACSNASCWNSTIAPVAAQVPVVTSELGENDCNHGFVDSYMDWADAHGISYLGWTWNTWDCGSGPSLITKYDGTPTNFGAGLQARLARLARA